MAYQMTRNPPIIGGTAVMAGYLWAMLFCVNRPVSSEFVAFVRREQMQRLKIFFNWVLPWHAAWQHSRSRK